MATIEELELELERHLGSREAAILWFNTNDISAGKTPLELIIEKGPEVIDHYIDWWNRPDRPYA